MVTYEDFRKAFAKAEEDIKYAELAICTLASDEDDEGNPGAEPRGVVVPSINELRYAAKHISNSLIDGISDEDKAVQIDKAIRHCVRARLDALKAILLFLGRHFYLFSQDYRLCTLPDEIRNQQNEIREKIVNGLKIISKSHPSSTNEECDMLQEKIQELHGFYLAVEKQRDSYNQLLYETRQGSKTSTILWVVGIIVSFVFGWFFAG
jgi:hypothetical protein